MKPPTEPIDILHMIVRMLTREGRVSFDFTESCDSLKITVNTINREYGRLLGGGGQAIRDINTLAKALIQDASVILESRADDNIKRCEEEPCQTYDLLQEFVSACDTLHGSTVEPGTDCALVKTGCQDDILLAAIDRTFYNIGRAQRSIFRITWNRL